MTGSKVLVLGATGPAGICLLRELVYRNHEVVAYVRNPSKIPRDLENHPLLKVYQGQMNEVDKIEAVVAQSGVVLSLLGPSLSRDVSPYAQYYSALFPLMRKHSVRRILAMGTFSIVDPEDSWSLLHRLITLIMRVVAPGAYGAILDIARVFAEEAHHLDWTIFRLGGIPGGHDEDSWRKDREDSRIFSGYVGQPGWTMSIKRAALARWMVDCVEDGGQRWIHRMPIVTKSAAKEN